MNKLQLSQVIPEQRAVYAAEERLALAEQDLFTCYGNHARPAVAAARHRHQQAMLGLELARVRLEKRKCDLANVRHLRIVVT